jgi:N-acetylneuraminic acid mutarotase
MATLYDKIYMFGGSGPQATCYYDLQIFDPQKNSWTVSEIHDSEGVVRARAGHSMTAVNDKVFIYISNILRY